MSTGSTEIRTESDFSAANVGERAADAVLVAAAKTGDGYAFEMLVNRYHSRIFAVALRYTKLYEDAEDATQQTFQKAFVNLQNFEGKSSFSTWLTRIAINESLMLLRKVRLLREVSIDDPANQDENAPSLELADASPNPEAHYILREGVRLLSVAIGQLMPEMRCALTLQLCEFTARETARYMGISIGAVKARLFHGRRKLHKMLRSLRVPRTSRRTPAIAHTDAAISQDSLARSACD